jgi:putative SOS response-associated peptidase YedK
MCGTLTRYYTWWQTWEMYSLFPSAPNLEPRYNICPTTTVDVVISGDNQRSLVPIRWGLIPSWWKKPFQEMRLATFNARAETIAEKSMFRVSFERRRCLMRVSGYCEWADTPDGKQPLSLSETPCSWRIGANSVMLVPNGPTAQIALWCAYWTDPVQRTAGSGDLGSSPPDQRA